ncbi:PP2C family serine/threonine-protein phosphatase [Chlamydia sp.]|uniref:PP2C family protein-serine/threonine phosphatase n=1 Tax=Chlamydia sp. TaxID=35827 RepID=UPI0025C61AAD|nr:PP2C family serine/threonine-protein phosphatase [Chlamydia sp.]MBQ8498340.1 serine/threonine-protein phosphatase [Chlamydia sp.]
MIVAEFEYFGLSDVGLVRNNNEDFWQVNCDSQIIAIADGMGGHRAGEVASYEAVYNLMQLVDLHKVDLERFNDDQYKNSIKTILSEVNSLIYRQSLLNEQFKGMGTTLSCMQFRRGKAWLFHVGDCRIYRLRRKMLERLTEDHSLANHLASRYGLSKQSVKRYPWRHVLTNVLGSRPHVSPDIREISYEKEDLFVFCSDGLTSAVSDSDMLEILTQTTTLEEGGNILISLANSRGGRDNATVILVRMR